MNNVMMTKWINRIFKKYFSYINVMLFLGLFVTAYFSIEVLKSYFNNDFVINVKERGVVLADYSSLNYHVGEREVHSVLLFKSNKFLDFLFVNKTSDHFLPLALFIAFVFFQMFRINANWYEKKFTNRLYNLIHALGFVAGIMFLFSRIQNWYLRKLIQEMSNNNLLLDEDQWLNSFAVAVMVISLALRSFARQGNKLQEEQDLTI